MKTTSRVLKGSIVTGDIRVATYQDREHVVLPVVALMEGVIHAINAETPELVREEDLAINPQAWNGRPVMYDHPQLNGQRVSANDPTILELYSLGTVFNTKLEDKKLKMEAWIDLKQAESVGKEAMRLVEKARARETIEVSVGTYVTAEKESGNYEGKAYKAVWHNIVPDHLALLPEGTKGACSIEMGCGAPRAAAKEEKNMEVKDSKSLRERWMAWLGLKQTLETAEDVSDSDLRKKIDAALYADEPGYLGINDVFPADSLVVFAVAPEEKVMTIRRGYTLADDGAVTLKEEREEVQPVTRYEPMNAEECPCLEEGGKKMIDEKRVKALIDCKKTPWAATDFDYLSGLSEERIAELEGFEPEVVVAPVVEQEIVEKVPEELFGLPIAEVEEMVTNARTAEAKKKTDLIDKIRTAAAGVYTDEELNVMEIPALEKLIKITEIKPVADYSGQGNPRLNEEGGVPDPPKISDKLQA